jgi:hypothetical protein
MAQFSRAMRRWHLLRILSVPLGLAWLAVLGAFAYASANSRPAPSTIVAAAALAVIAGACFLYAWRDPGA